MRLDRALSWAGLAALAVVMPLATAAGQTAPTCTTPTAEDVAGLHERWVASLATRHPDKVLRNYAADAVLMGLDANKVRTTLAEIRDYYVYFLARDPKVKTESRTVRLGCGTALDTGVHAMTLAGKTPGTTESVLVRYSFSYEHHDGTWLMVHHHASLMPESTARPPVVAGFVKRTGFAAAAPPAARPRPVAEAEPAETPLYFDTIFGRITYRSGDWSSGVPTFGDR